MDVLPRDMKKTYKHRVSTLLSDAENDFLYRCVKKYKKSQDVGVFSQEVRQILTSREKMKLLPYVRNLVSERDRSEFNHLLASQEQSLIDDRRDARSEKDHCSSTAGSYFFSTDHIANVVFGAVHAVPNGRSDLRVITIMNRDENLGFSIRGGSENGLGIFVSEVDSGSSAARGGLHAGDQILEANNINLEHTTCSSAVGVITGQSKLKLVIKRTGKVPEWKLAKEKVLWYDVHQREIIAAPATESDTFHIQGLDTDHVHEKRVALKIISKTDFLGMNIRGGSEYGLGIYVSRVDSGGLAEKHGICPGDRIVDVNGTSFHSISHSYAVGFLRSHEHLILTLREVGRYPAFKEVYAEYTWSDKAGKSRNPGRVPVSDSSLSGDSSTVHSEKLLLVKKTQNLGEKSNSSGGLPLQTEIYLPQQNREFLYQGNYEEAWHSVYIEDDRVDGLHDWRKDKNTLDVEIKSDIYNSDNNSEQGDDYARFLERELEESEKSKVVRDVSSTENVQVRPVMSSYEQDPHVSSISIDHNDDVSKQLTVNEKQIIPSYENLVTREVHRTHHDHDPYVMTVAVEDSDGDSVDNVEYPYSTVNKVKDIDVEILDNEEQDPNSGEVTPQRGTLTPEEEIVLQTLDDQIQWLEDRKSHLGTKAVSQIKDKDKENESDEESGNKFKSGKWANIKKKLRGSIRLKPLRKKKERWH